MLNFLKNIFPFSKKISLAVIFLEYDRQQNGGSTSVFKTLQGYLADIKRCHTTFLRVDNKNERIPFQQITKNIYTIGGDNQYREFSGWQKGFEHLQQLNTAPDLILFVNDMFLVPGESFLKDYANRELLETSLSDNSIIGRIDSTGQHYTAYAHDVSKWVCTNCFLAPRKAMEAIGNMVSIKENLDDFLPTNCPITDVNTPQKELALKLFKKDAPINDTYKLWLVEWLTERWHSKFDIQEDTWELFRTKTRNILNESLLTARLAEAGYTPQSYGDTIYY